MFDIAKREGWFQVLKKVAAAQREREELIPVGLIFCQCGLKEAR
jgi:hypothetical protein